MKRFVVTGFLVFLGVLPLFLGLACKVDGPSNPSDGFPSALGTIVGSNPSFTPTPTASVTPTGTPTSTPCSGFIGTPTPGISSFTDGANMYLNQISSGATTALTTLNIWTAGAVSVEAGIYDDNGSAPTTLLGETGAHSAVAGFNSYDLLTSPVSLTPSKSYWLALHASGPVDFTGAAPVSTYISPVGTGFTGLPATIGTGTFQVTPGPSSPSTLLSLSGIACGP